MRIRRIALAFAVSLGLAACTDPPPPGGDLIAVSCNCSDSCLGDAVIIRGDVCTDGSNPENVDQAKKFICDQKETIGANVCKIENCVPFQAQSIDGGCPADNGSFHAGDFALATSRALPGSIVHVKGDHIIDFSIHPDDFEVTTTRNGSTLFFGSFVGFLGTKGFESDGFFSNPNHTLRDGRILGGPFAVAIDDQGNFEVPEGTGNFITTGEIDGDRLSLTLTSLDLHGHYDEDANSFVLQGTVKAQREISMSFVVDLHFTFENRPPRANAGPDRTVECDQASGGALVHLSGAASTDLEGPGDIKRFSWFLEDPDQEVAVGPEVDVAIPLGNHEVTLAVADQAGSFGADTALVAVADTQAPSLTIVEPRPIEYLHSRTIVLDYGAEDACGLAASSATLDGADTLAGHGLENGQPIHLLTELGLGEHVFAVEAADAQGNGTSSVVTFSVVVSPESIQEAVEQFVGSGDADPNFGASVLMRLRSAADHYRGGNCRAAVGIYRSFINTVEARRGKAVTPAAADIMIADAAFLIDHCPQVFGEGG